jgi:Fe2+ transport system protein FeoA
VSVLRPLSLLAFASALLVASGAAAAECPAPLPGAEDWPGQKRWQALEQAGYAFGQIAIEVIDVYESNAEWYAEAVNLLHVETRDRVVREHLLIAKGTPVVARTVYETERKLRSLGFLRGARIEPIACADGIVETRVTVEDSWTLKFGIRANRVGGENQTGLRLEDTNFFGTGKTVGIDFADDATRSSTSIFYRDPALFGSRWQASVLHADQSDGTVDSVTASLPFFTRDQVWGAETYWYDGTVGLDFYQSGDTAWSADASYRDVLVRGQRLIALDGDSGWRVGFGVRDYQAAYGPLVAVDPTLRPPPTLVDRRLAGPVISISRFHDHFASFRNFRLVDRVEDYNLGLDATLSLASFDESFGSSMDALRPDLTLRWGGRYGDGLVLVDASAGGRLSDGDWSDGSARAGLLWYAPHATRHTLVTQLSFEVRDDAAPEDEVHLGGADGLLGYPARWVVGDRAWRAHLGERVLTEQVLFQTLRVGWTAFVEAGQAREIGTKEWSKVYADVGGGFRLGNLRGAWGTVLYFTVVAPLVREPGVDAWQIVIGDVIEF